MRVLILGGTAESAALARRLAMTPGIAVVTSLAGRTRSPAAVAGELRIGGFGGVTGLTDYLRTAGIDRVVDASHPFAAQIATTAEQACRQTGVPRLKLLRPAWQPGAAERWLEVADATAAAEALPESDARVFLAIGRQRLAPFAVRPALWFLLRMVDAPDQPLPLPQAEIVLGRGPFTLEAELALLNRHRIGWLVCRNSGGDAGREKLTAARQAGVAVVMIARPPPPEGPVAVDPAAAIGWLNGSGTSLR